MPTVQKKSKRRRTVESEPHDRTVISVSRKDYDAFVARLDAPPRPSERLKRSLRKSAPWEK